MDEKTMVNDVLSNVKAELSSYETAITETENLQLRQTLQKLRDDCETFQYELFKVAKSKNYYKPARIADETEIQDLANQLKNC